MGCLVESTLWFLCTGRSTQNRQRRNGALGGGSVKDPSLSLCDYQGEANSAFESTGGPFPSLKVPNASELDSF